jgi:hypothetical protein
MWTNQCSLKFALSDKPILKSTKIASRKKDNVFIATTKAIFRSIVLRRKANTNSLNRNTDPSLIGKIQVRTKGLRRNPSDNNKTALRDIENRTNPTSMHHRYALHASKKSKIPTTTTLMKNDVTSLAARTARLSDEQQEQWVQEMNTMGINF